MSKYFPIAFNPKAKLPENGEELLKAAFRFQCYAAVSYTLGMFFLNEAIDELFSYFDRDAKNAYEARRWMLISHINTEDKPGFRSLCNYWWDWDRLFGSRRGKIMNVTKYVPGDHFHAVNERFDTLNDAVRYIREQGYTFGRFDEVHIYKERQ